ncbi:NUMOD4 domain-containing protein [Sinorhizobium meliloti]|uniref:NUMOD4 domain-containing protein n=1 Tax=Rhizobium meliloti TaxID=382 RepID=UPI00020F3C29|nr:NUMOD4 domain-containing protein [Sinorhizobium meliloti]AEG53180.1 NUMOD4 domain protein [Sinorhizobium meliloti AK83]MDE4591104.1 hypothetical protein [Sinorhizobium meliloti]SEI56665.1 HNH endonuclease [Sinorhizobium meliloti]
MTMEVWKDIAEHAGYQVSNLGRVRSVDRIIEVRCPWGHIVKRRLKGKILKATVHPETGYVHVTMGAGVTKMVHRLVAKVFVPNPLNLPEVNHEDLDRTNNVDTNLTWVTSSGNKDHSYASGTRKQHGLTQPVRLVRPGYTLQFDSMLDAAKHIDRNPGSVASAFHRGHLCAGWQVEAG